jgi:hypothetical protein
MRNLKHEFIEKYIFPLLEPIKNESKSLLIAYIFAVIVILLGILKFQFLATQE